MKAKALVVLLCLLGIAAGFFLKWWAITAILALQVLSMFYLILPGDTQNESLAGKIARTILPFHVPAWIVFSVMVYGHDILNALSQTLR